MKRKKLNGETIEKLSRYSLPELEYSAAFLYELSPGEYLLREGEPMECLYLLLEGTASVHIGVSSGRRMQICRFVSEGIIGDVELMSGRYTALTTMRALSKLTLVALPFANYAERLRQDIVFVNRVGKELAEKLIQSDTTRVVTILHDTESLLCAYILQRSDQGIFSEKRTAVAETLGISYRHLLRCLNALLQKGILTRLSDGGYAVANWALLSERAGDISLMGL